ncbi:hypothetical protein HNP99_003322 [Flavobacterium sp. 28A]|uniref:TonB-dependent receptor n=1 Tax=Flavobacterium sp. 28A TaxID=2735895 RepID=UPI00157116F0|nr:carboxypeptidase-like regulatory domain-containing protein [Flavobacterium sp. 28A]NRT16948.1 hypothetical protein [Flavobacterium sp. 28A]
MAYNKYLICIIFCLHLIGYSQSKENKIPLTQLITKIEKQFDVKFSYAVEDVTNIAITPPNEMLSLTQTLAYLNANVLLNFKTLDNRYVTVSVLNKTFTICSVLLDSNSKTPLIGATIHINNTGLHTVSNNKGRFKINGIPINAFITISYIGYEEKIYTAKQLFSTVDSCIELLLKPSKEELNQVLITSFLTSGLQKYLDGSTVLNTKKFGILPGLIEPDILQSIQALPGIESTNESIANINVRGGTNDQNLMIWDNIKMYHSGHFFGLISAYNPNLTNKVEVIKNGTSAAYSDGVSSTILMHTNDKVGNSFSGGAGINLISADAFLEIPLAANLQLDISGRRSVTDLINTPTFTNYFDRSFQDSEIKRNSEGVNTNSDFYFYDYTAKLLFDLNDKHEFRANIIGINNALVYNEINSNTATESKSSSLAQKNVGYGANWNANWNSKFNTQLIGYYSKYNIDAIDYRIINEQQLTEANEVLETGIKLSSNYTVSKFLKLLMGYQFTETGMLNQTTVKNPDYSSTKKDVLANHAFYVETEYHKNNSYLRIGARLNYYEKFKKLLFEPRINFRQQLTAAFSIKFEGEFKNQTSTQVIDFEDDFLGVEKRRWVLVNNNTIPIAKSKQASLGIGFKRYKLNIDLTGFYKIVDGITASNQGFYNNFQYETANGIYTNKGVEFLINKTTQKYSTWLSYTFSRNDYEFASFTPSEFPNNVDIRHSFSVGYNYSITNNFKVSIGANWRNGQPYTTPVTGNETIKKGNTTRVNYDAPNSQNLDNFMRLDASLSYSFQLSKKIKANLNAGVINFTNEKNTINRYYKVDPTTTDKTIQVDNKSLGITPNASLRINF